MSLSTHRIIVLGIALVERTRIDLRVLSELQIGVEASSLHAYLSPRHLVSKAPVSHIPSSSSSTSALTGEKSLVDSAVTWFVFVTTYSAELLVFSFDAASHSLTAQRRISLCIAITSEINFFYFHWCVHVCMLARCFTQSRCIVFMC